MSLPQFRVRGKAALAAAPAIIETPAAPALILPDAMRARFARQHDQKVFRPSPQQQAYFDWIQNGSGNLIMEAVAGAGKSTTLVQGFQFMNGNVTCQAYNTAAADDLKAKAAELKAERPGLRISTMHSSGLYHWRNAHKNVEVKSDKPRKMLEGFIGAYPAHKVAKDYATFINKMISFGKQFLIGCPAKPADDNMTIWLKLMDHFSVDQDLPENVKPQLVMEWVIELFRMHREACPKIIDFDDMLYAPFAYNQRIYGNAWVLVDECQDINPARREMAKKLIGLGGRAVFVGDSRQAIYGFTGAGGDSIQRIIEEFNCQKLPLTVTYRCPKTVVNFAHQWVDHIEAHPDAPEGVVREVKYVPERACTTCNQCGVREERDGRMTTCDVCAGRKRIPADPWFVQDAPSIEDVIICRYTRPLIQTAYSMIKIGIACKVEGRDIGRGLVTLARMWKITTIARLEERLAVYQQREMAKAQAAGSDKRAQEIEDKVGTLGIFIARCKERNSHLIDDLVREIETLFADNVTGVITLCTGHKSKGREWKRVFWIRTAGGRPIQKEWEAREEENVQYVIATRAKEELILVPENIDKKRG